MNGRATLPSLLWFTLLGPLLMIVLAAIGTVVNAVDLGLPLAHADGLLLVACSRTARNCPQHEKPNRCLMPHTPT